ncbi:MAG: hypothetical protein FJ403_19715 [Verrucomicrobia bacterium]|nr:hypothetical protein [Verrucomicrobiota bacterium]
MIAVRALGKIGAAAQPALPNLKEFLNSGRAETAVAAAAAILRIERTPDQQAVSALEREVKNALAPSYGRLSAIKALLEAGLSGQVMKETVEAIFRGPDHPHVKITAAALCLRLRERNDEAMQFLTNALASSEAVAGDLAAQALGNLGELALPAVPALSQALQNREPRLRIAVRRALWRINSATTSQKP